MINLARTFNRRAGAEQPLPGQPALDRSKEQSCALEHCENALSEREAALTAREAKLTVRERRLLEAEAVLSHVAEPSHDISTLLSNVDLSVAPRSREVSIARAEIILAVGRKWGSPVLAAPTPVVSPTVRDALRVLEQRQAPLQAARLEREVEAKAQADALVAVAKKFGIRVLANDE